MTQPQTEQAHGTEAPALIDGSCCVECGRPAHLSQSRVNGVAVVDVQPRCKCGAPLRVWSTERVMELLEEEAKKAFMHPVHLLGELSSYEEKPLCAARAFTFVRLEVEKVTCVACLQEAIRLHRDRLRRYRQERGATSEQVHRG